MTAFKKGAANSRGLSVQKYLPILSTTTLLALSVASRAGAISPNHPASLARLSSLISSLKGRRLLVKALMMVMVSIPIFQTFHSSLHYLGAECGTGIVVLLECQNENTDLDAKIKVTQPGTVAMFPVCPLPQH